MVACVWWSWGLSVSDRRASYRYVGAWTQAHGEAFNDPFGVAVDARNENVLVTDARNQRVVLFDTEGGFLRQFGTEGTGPGQFERPTGIAVGADGSIYVADFQLDRIQRFTDSGDFVLAWGRSGSGADEFQAPTGLALDAEGHVYVADFQDKVVKVFSDEGKPLGVIGKPGRWGPGRLHYPTDVVIAPNADIIVADAYNHRLQRFGQDGSHRASWGRHLFWLVPRPAAGRKGFHVPTSVVFDPVHRLIHVADSANRRVVMLDADGAFVTEWPLPEPGAHYHPTMLAVAPDGKRLYATDVAKNRVLVLEVQADEEQQTR
jgi:DNA-binding beta-propeller fold protein YncE